MSTAGRENMLFINLRRIKLDNMRSKNQVSILLFLIFFISYEALSFVETEKYVSKKLVLLRSSLVKRGI